VSDRELPGGLSDRARDGHSAAVAPGIVNLVTARTVQGMARVRSGQAPALVGS